MIQETHEREATREVRKQYTWYFSGGTQAGTIFEGVGVIIRKDLRNYVKDVQAINERIMVVTLRGKVDLHLFSAYAPTAAADADTKEALHKQPRKEVNTRKKKGLILIGADMNAELVERGGAETEGIG